MATLKKMLLLSIGLLISMMMLSINGAYAASSNKQTTFQVTAEAKQAVKQGIIVAKTQRKKGPLNAFLR